MVKEIVNESVFRDGVRLLIVNVLYFADHFVLGFDPKLTREKVNFYADRRRMNVMGTVTMMHSKESWHWIARKVDGVYDVIKMDYQNSPLSLVMAIENHGHSASTHNVISGERILQSLNGYFGRMTKCNLFVPKFKIHSHLDLKSTLCSMGMSDAFAVSADFSGISETKSNGLYIGNVIHKAVVEVDEKGTRTSAASAATMNMRCDSAEPEIPTISLDHPFTFYIIDEVKQLILFIGRFSGEMSDRLNGKKRKRADSKDQAIASCALPPHFKRRRRNDDNTDTLCPQFAKLISQSFK